MRVVADLQCLILFSSGDTEVDSTEEGYWQQVVRDVQAGHVSTAIKCRL
jgi:hypothetical protein